MKRLIAISAVSLVILSAVIGLSARVGAQADAPARSPSASQTPARDAVGVTRPEQARAIIRGRVIDAASGRPLYRARVMLSGANPPTAVTGDDGRFEMRNVPPGTYVVSAARAGYLTFRYRQERPRELGQAVMVRDGEAVEDINIALFKGAVLAGRVLDEDNEPGSGIRVDAMTIQYQRGRCVPVQAGFATTNDLGEFRIIGLEPGTYYLQAATSEMWADEDLSKTKHAYAVTFFPGVAGVEQAQTVTLAIGQETVNLDFQLVAGRAARVSGTVRRANGDAVNGQPVSLTRILPGGALEGVVRESIRTDQSGFFTIPDVPPGEYALTSSGAPGELANLRPVVVQDADIEGLLVTPRRTATLSGSIVTDEGIAPTFPQGQLKIIPLPLEDISRLPLYRAMGSWAFQFQFLLIDGGKYLFRTEGLPAEWMLKAVRLDDRDITDVPFEIPTGLDTKGLQIVLSRTAGSIEGDIVKASGAPDAGSAVIVFPPDDRQWSYGTRVVKASRPDKSGHFSIGGLPAGPYLVAAAGFVVEGQWEDPAYLRTLAATATPVTVNEKGIATVKLVTEVERR